MDYITGKNNTFVKRVINHYAQSFSNKENHNIFPFVEELQLNVDKSITADDVERYMYFIISGFIDCVMDGLFESERDVKE